MSSEGPAWNATFSCLECDKAFGSAAHLKRHRLIHSQERGFACHVCRKAFSRADALTRHVRIHNSEPNLNARGPRACLACAEAKVRCTADTPSCARCRRRAVACVYPAMAARTLHEDLPSHDDLRGAMAVPSIPYEDLPNAMDDVWASLDSTTNWLDSMGNEFPVDMPLIIDPTFEPAVPHFNMIPATALTGVQEPQTLHTPQSANSSQTNGTHVADSFSSISASTWSGRTRGTKYVDGQPGRKALKRKRRHQRTEDDEIEPRAPPAANNISLTEEMYQHMVNQYDMLCLQHSPLWTSVDCMLPAKEVIQHLLGLFFEEFETLPFLHNSFELAQADMNLILAMTTIGSHYVQRCDMSENLFACLLEFTRRSLLRETEMHGERPPGLHHGTLLHFVASRYGGGHHGRKAALASRSTLQDMIGEIIAEMKDETASMMGSGKWQDWIKLESRRRFAYSIFFVDCLIAFDEGLAPTIDSSLLDMPLPCRESIWMATSEQDWMLRMHNECNASGASLRTTLEHLYVEKRLHRTHGQFAQTLVVLGLTSRQDRVTRYYRNSLSGWIPKARKESSQDVLPAGNVWLPSNPTWCAWENGFCDALDVVHWLCNATTGESAGMEPPLTGFLHIARVIALTPLHEILSFARTGSRQEMEVIQKWVVGHQYKARLAMIHCGTTLWHYRRYSTSSFQEPSFVAYATLCLWAWSLFAPGVASAAPSISEDSDEACDLILIDRPADDEIVQHFIRKGYSMQVHVTNVGDVLRDAKAPQKILMQGLKILRGLGGWDTSIWVAHLRKLISSYEQQSVGDGQR